MNDVSVMRETPSAAHAGHSARRLSFAWFLSRREALAVALLSLGLCWLGSHFSQTPFTNYSLLADAFVHGRIWIDWPGPFIDAVLWEGHRYVINDPMPAVLLVPFALAFGTNTNQTLLGAVLCAVGMYAAARLAQSLDCPRPARYWLLAFLLAGTDFLWCATLGDVWFLAQVCATCFVLIALNEIARANRPWVVALAFSAAVLSRFTLVMALPAVFALSAYGFDGIRSIDVRRRFAQFAAALAPVVAVYVLYNELRWHVPYDSGHTIFFHQDGAGSPFGSPFGLHNVPNQLYSFFMAAPTFIGAWPWLRPEITGISLTFTSPAIVYAFAARRPWPTVPILWIAALFALGPSLFYYANGYAQFGMRHALDFEPFLFVLMLLAARQAAFPRWVVLLCLFSMAAGAYGVWYWRAFTRPF